MSKNPNRFRSVRSRLFTFPALPTLSGLPALSTLLLGAALVGATVFGAGTAGAANTGLKDLMKKMGAVAAGTDPKPLAPMLAQAKGMKPNDPEYAAWDGLADKGKAAAESGDLAGAKASCKDCHNQYKDKYKAKYGSKAP